MVKLPTLAKENLVEYNYVLTTHYDGNYFSSHRLENALEAAEAFAKCVDHGNAQEYATYNLLEPNGKMHTKNFYSNGKVTIK